MVSYLGTDLREQFGYYAHTMSVISGSMVNSLNTFLLSSENMSLCCHLLVEVAMKDGTK